MGNNARKKAKNETSKEDSAKSDIHQPARNEAEPESLRPYPKKISEDDENLRGRERWFKQRSRSRSK